MASGKDNPYLRKIVLGAAEHSACLGSYSRNASRTQLSVIATIQSSPTHFQTFPGLHAAKTWLRITAMLK
jgi:hypothetical protein